MLEEVSAILSVVMPTKHSLFNSDRPIRFKRRERRRHQFLGLENTFYDQGYSPDSGRTAYGAANSTSPIVSAAYSAVSPDASIIYVSQPAHVENEAPPPYQF